MMWEEHLARVGDGRDVYRVLVGKPEGRRTLVSARRGREDWIKMDLMEVGGWGVRSGFSWLGVAGLGGLL
jgi:hypothetical protein